jgi:phosphate transport system substrate-binding protein
MVTWVVGTDAKGNTGVADAVSRKIGAIGYVELSYAVANNLKFGAVRNKDGTYVVPSFESVTAAAAALLKDIPDDLRYSLVDAPGADSYPIAGTAWALLPVPKGGKPRPEVLKFLEWATHEGQKDAITLGYAPLPPNLVLRLDALFYRLSR